MKKRIFSIMDTGRKKTGVSILCGVFVLTMGTGMAFASNSNKPSKQLDRPLNAQSAQSAQIVTEADQAMFPTSVVEWWTYDGYKEWMEEQITNLQDLADDGVSDYYDKDGILRDFTQADVDSATKLYQSILEDIKRGVKVSKTVNGSTDTLMSYDPRDLETGISEESTATSSAVFGETINSDDTHWDTQERDYYEQYASFGLVYRDEKLYFNSKPVRCFDDWYSLGDGMSAGRSYFNEDGTVDVYAERDFSQIVHNADGSYDPSGKLVGVRAVEQAEFDSRDLSSYTEPAAPIASASESMRESLSLYEPFGVSYDSEVGMMMYDGLPVREIYNHKLAALVTLSLGTGFDDGVIPKNAIDLRAVYNGNVLTGLKKSTQAEFDSRTKERLDAVGTTVTAQSSAKDSDGKTFAQVFESYVAFGLSFNPNSVNGGLGNIYYNGQLVKKFIDLAPDGGVFSCSSSDGGDITVRTLYDENGKLSGLEII